MAKLLSEKELQSHAVTDVMSVIEPKRRDVTGIVTGGTVEIDNHVPVVTVKREALDKTLDDYITMLVSRRNFTFDVRLDVRDVIPRILEHLPDFPEWSAQAYEFAKLIDSIVQSTHDASIQGIQTDRPMPTAVVRVAVSSSPIGVATAGVPGEPTAFGIIDIDRKCINRGIINPADELPSLKGIVAQHGGAMVQVQAQEPLINKRSDLRGWPLSDPAGIYDSARNADKPVTGDDPSPTPFSGGPGKAEKSGGETASMRQGMDAFYDSDPDKNSAAAQGAFAAGAGELPEEEASSGKAAAAVGIAALEGYRMLREREKAHGELEDHLNEAGNKYAELQQQKAESVSEERAPETGALPSTEIMSTAEALDELNSPAPGEIQQEAMVAERQNAPSDDADDRPDDEADDGMDNALSEVEDRGPGGHVDVPEPSAGTPGTEGEVGELAAATAAAEAEVTSSGVPETSAADEPQRPVSAPVAEPPSATRESAAAEPARAESASTAPAASATEAPITRGAQHANFATDEYIPSAPAPSAASAKPEAAAEPARTTSSAAVSENRAEASVATEARTETRTSTESGTRAEPTARAEPAAPAEPTESSSRAEPRASTEAVRTESSPRAESAASSKTPEPSEVPKGSEVPRTESSIPKEAFEHMHAEAGTHGEPESRSSTSSTHADARAETPRSETARADATREPSTRAETRETSARTEHSARSETSGDHPAARSVDARTTGERPTADRATADRTTTDRPATETRSLSRDADDKPSVTTSRDPSGGIESAHIHIEMPHQDLPSSNDHGLLRQTEVRIDNNLPRADTGAATTTAIHHIVAEGGPTAQASPAAVSAHPVAAHTVSAHTVSAQGAAVDPAAHISAGHTLSTGPAHTNGATAGHTPSVQASNGPATAKPIQVHIEPMHTEINAPGNYAPNLTHPVSVDGAGNSAAPIHQAAAHSHSSSSANPDATANAGDATRFTDHATLNHSFTHNGNGYANSDNSPSFRTYRPSDIGNQHAAPMTHVSQPSQPAPHFDDNIARHSLVQPATNGQNHFDFTNAHFSEGMPHNAPHITHADLSPQGGPEPRHVNGLDQWTKGPGGTDFATEALPFLATWLNGNKTKDDPKADPRQQARFAPGFKNQPDPNSEKMRKKLAEAKEKVKAGDISIPGNTPAAHTDEEPPPPEPGPAPEGLGLG